MTGVQDILAEVGYPTRTMVLDAETFFDAEYSLKKLTSYEYITDPRFELLGWAVKVNDAGPGFPRDLPPIDWDTTTIIVHNAQFDCLVLKHLYGVLPPYVIDTLDLARHVEPRWSNALKALAERHGLTPKGDTNQFKGKRRVDFTPEEWSALVEYATTDAELEYLLLCILLPKLTNPVTELETMKYTREIFTNPVLRFDGAHARQIRLEMQAENDRIVKQSGHTQAEISGNNSFEALLRAALAPEDPPTKQGKKKELLAISKKDPGYDLLLKHPKAEVRSLMEARVAVKSWPLHIKRVINIENVGEAAGHFMPVPLKYYGAHTGRWSGGGGINFHNLPAHGAKVLSAIRGILVAPDGTILLILDFSQIEARVLVWLADQMDMVRKFATGVQIYCEFASALTGKHIRKPKKTDPKAVADWHGKYRQLGKVGTLGCGYGMGKDKCQDYAKNTYDVDIDNVMAEQVVKLYRRQNPMVVLFWQKVEQAFTLALTGAPRPVEMDHGLQFSHEDNVVKIRLPNGRCLYYTGAALTGSSYRRQIYMPHPKEGFKIHMWGGYLVENIVQAASRDILAEAVLDIRRELRLRVPLTVHDDMSIVIPVDRQEELVPRVIEIVRRTPVWAPGLPIDIEYKLSERYMKI